jgi:hypothetical protein
MATNKDEYGFCNLCGLEHKFIDLKYTETYALNDKYTDWLYLCQSCYNHLLMNNKIYYKPKTLELDNNINWNCFKINKLKSLKVNSRKALTANTILDLLKLVESISLEELLKKLDDLNEINKLKLIYSPSSLINNLWENGLIQKGRKNRNIFIKISKEVKNLKTLKNLILETKTKNRKKNKKKVFKINSQLSFLNLEKYKIKRTYNFKKIKINKNINNKLQLSFFD